jgi:hypothetical protein
LGPREKAHTYHFVTIETIDVDIIEQRNPGKMMFANSGSGGLGVTALKFLLENGVSSRIWTMLRHSRARGYLLQVLSRTFFSSHMAMDEGAPRTLQAFLKIWMTRRFFYLLSHKSIYAAFLSRYYER